MKKINLFIICILVLVLITGCKSKDKNNKNIEEEPQVVSSLSLSLSSLNIEVGEAKEVSVILENATDYIYEVSKKYIVGITKNGNTLTIEGINEGEVNIKVYLEGQKDKAQTINVLVAPKEEKYLTVTPNELMLSIGKSSSFSIDTNVDLDSLSITKNNDNITLDGFNVTGMNCGSCVITIESSEYNLKSEVKVIIMDENDKEAPTFSFDDTQDIKVLWGVKFDPLADIHAVDNNDGDISDKIKVIKNEVDTKDYGTYEVTYEVSDYNGNKRTVSRNVEVYWGYNVKFIGHAGSYYGVQNSEEAMLMAVDKLKYQALECDLKVTSDGVFVLFHDDTFGGLAIGSSTFAQLQKVQATSSRTGGIPATNGDLAGFGLTGKYSCNILTLERYLEICKEYNAEAIIELKGCNGIAGTNLTNMPKLMKQIEDAGMLNQVTFLASNYHALIWVKENGYEYIPCQYLVNEANKQEYLDRCIKYGFDLSLNVTYGTNIDHPELDIEWIKKFQAVGCKISTWTFTQYCDYKQVQQWIDLGVDYLTCDWQKMDRLDLSKALPTGDKHNVKFVDYDGSVICEKIVPDGKSVACATQGLKRTGYTFDGWDQDTTCIKSDLIINAVYSPIEYEIKYQSNLYVIEDGQKIYLTRAQYTAPLQNTYTIEDSFTLPSPESNLTFLGWYMDSNCTLPMTKIDKGTMGEIEVYAKWDGLSYTKYESNIEYILDGGTNDPSNKDTYVEGITLNLASPTKAGYDFIGWTKEEGSTEYITVLNDHTTGDVTLYANFELHVYNISYELNGGTWFNDPKVEGSPYGTVNTTSNDSNYFVVYQSNCFLYRKDAFSNAVFSRRIYLKQLIGNYFEFVHYSNSGEDKYDGEYDYFIVCDSTYSTGYNQINNVMKDAAIGDIIYVDGDLTTGVSVVKFYKKANVSGLDSSAAISTYTIDELPLILPTPYKDGYTFVGWSLSSLLSDTFTTLPTDTMQDIKLYAKFE